MNCGRCFQGSDKHPDGNCPDGQGSFTFTASHEVMDWLRANPDLPEDKLAEKWIEHVRSRGTK